MFEAKAKPKFTLEQSERNSPLWAKLAAHFEERLATTRNRNDSDHDEAATAKLRGRIAELRYTLSLGADKTPTEE